MKTYDLLLLTRRSTFVIAALVLFGFVAPAWAESWDDIVVAAEKEGVVTVIAPPVPTHRATLEKFKEAYPKIKLQISAMANSEFEPRVDAERKAGLYNWDVMVPGAGPTTYTLYIANHWLVPIRDVLRPEVIRDDLWLGGFDAGFLDKEKKFVYGFAATRSKNMYVNRSIIPEKDLNKITDLLKPEFKGRIVMFDPRVGGPGGSLAAQLLVTLGKDKTTAFFRDQDLTFSTTPRQLAEWVIRGQYPIGLALVDRDMTEYQARGLASNIEALPIDRAVVNPQWGVLNVFNNAPHPNAARVFANWLLSQDAMSDWAVRSGSNTRRLDAKRGDPGNVVTAEDWINGLDFSAEAQLPARVATSEMLKSVFK